MADKDTLEQIISNLKRDKAELIDENERLKKDYEELWKRYHMAEAKVLNRESIIKSIEGE